MSNQRNDAVPMFLYVNEIESNKNLAAAIESIEQNKFFQTLVVEIKNGGRALVSLWAEGNMNFTFMSREMNGKPWLWMFTSQAEAEKMQKNLEHMKNSIIQITDVDIKSFLKEVAENEETGGVAFDPWSGKRAKFLPRKLVQLALQINT